MVKPQRDSESDNMAANRLVERKGKLTWKALADELGFNQGYLYRVARGDRPASNAIRIALGLHPLHVTVDPCARCGSVHVSRRCTANAPKYAPHPVMRITELRRRIKRLHFAEQVLDEIERELTR